MTCTLCGFELTGFDAIMAHASAAHPDIRVRKPTSKERKAVIVQVVEEHLKVKFPGGII